jgi:AcrR family transcriptional regulator
MRDGTRTRARIEAEALRLFAERGIAATSIRDIAGAVGVAEGALYRHFASKDELARTLFMDGYAALARRIQAAGLSGEPFGMIVEKVIRIFCELFDENRPLFSFLLLSQHAFLSEVARDASANVVEAVAEIFRRAMAEGAVAPGDPDLVAAMALGIVAQPATFTVYGRLAGPMSARVPALARAVLLAAGAAAPAPMRAGPAIRVV